MKLSDHVHYRYWKKTIWQNICSHVLVTKEDSPLFFCSNVMKGLCDGGRRLGSSFKCNMLLDTWWSTPFWTGGCEDDDDCETVRCRCDEVELSTSGGSDDDDVNVDVLDCAGELVRGSCMETWLAWWCVGEAGVYEKALVGWDLGPKLVTDVGCQA